MHITKRMYQLCIARASFCRLKCQERKFCSLWFFFFLQNFVNWEFKVPSIVFFCWMEPSKWLQWLWITHCICNCAKCAENSDQDNKKNAKTSHTIPSTSYHIIYVLEHSIFFPNYDKKCKTIAHVAIVANRKLGDIFQPKNWQPELRPEVLVFLKKNTIP